LILYKHIQKLISVTTLLHLNR